MLDRGIQALERVIEPLLEPVQQRGHARFGAADGQMRQPLAGLQELEARGAFQAMRLRCEMLGDLVLGLGDELGCGGGRGRAQVGDKVRDGEVGFVSDRGNDGQPRRSNGARDLLAVEGGKIFKRTAAAGEHDEVDEIRRHSARPARLQSQPAQIRPARRPERAAHSGRSGGGSRCSESRE